MSRRTREINRITTAIITISIKLMVLALLILLLYEAVVRGFAFGHEIFYAEAAEAAPGREITVEIKEGETAKEAAGELKKKGLITNDFAFWFQSIFYDYQDIYPGIYTLNTSMTSKEILRELNVKPEEESEASPEARTVSGEADLSKDADSSENRKTRAVQAEPAAVSETAAPEAEEAEAELDGEDIYMEEEDMIVNDRITDYIQSLETSQGSVLDEIEKEALDQFVPIIRKETAAFLRTMTAALKPSAILEIGTAVGYSALQMCRVMPEHCRITTIEKYEKRLPIARENFHRAGESGRITLLEGDADVHLKELAKKGCQFDLVFMDAAKGQYLNWLPMVLDLMPKGAVLISDNVLQDGDIIQSRFAVERRNRTIHSRMREYLYELKHTEELETSVIPIGDGVTVSTKVR